MLSQEFSKSHKECLVLLAFKTHISTLTSFSSTWQLSCNSHLTCSIKAPNHVVDCAQEVERSKDIDDIPEYNKQLKQTLPRSVVIELFIFSKNKENKHHGNCWAKLCEVVVNNHVATNISGPSYVLTATKSPRLWLSSCKTRSVARILRISRLGGISN